MPEIKVTAAYDGAAVDKGLNNLQKELAETAVAAQKMDSALGKGVTKGANQASNAVNNFSRIVQDAPFGIIGITNNINPLLESFQRLKVETGSTTGAFKAMIGSLAGGAGLGLAVSLATSLLTTLAVNGFFKSKEAADEGAKANENYKKTLEGIFSNVAQEAAQVTGLIAVLKSETETRERKLAALQKLRDISPEIFNGLTLERGAVQGLDVAYQSYISSLKVVIAAKIKQQQIEDAITKLLKLQGIEQTSLEKGALKAAAAWTKSENARIGALGGRGQDPNFARNLIKESEIRELEAKIADFTKQLTEFSKGIDTPKLKKEAKKVVAKIKQEFLDIKTDLGPLVLTPELVVEFPDVLTRGSFQKELDGLAASLRDSTAEIFANPVAIQEAQAKAYLAGIGITKGLQDGVTVGVNGLRFPELIALAKSLQEQRDIIQAELQAMGADIATAFGQAIGQAFVSGTGFLSAALSSILNIVGDFLIKLGKAAILQSALIKAIQAANPLSGLAAGIAAVAAGFILKNIKLPAFATGGVTPGGAILVGERGPEIITPPSGSRITPNAQTNSLLGGAMGNVVLYSRIDGKDIVLSNQRTLASNSRKGQ